MPIHDQGYRRYGGDRAVLGRSWMVITSAGIRSMVSKRKFLFLLLLGWGPFLARAIQIYASANLPNASFLTVTARTFREFLDQQQPFIFFVTIYAGAGLIANDRRANALQIYLSKPLTRAEYVAGKLGVLMTFLLLVTWAPAILLLFVQMMLAGNVTFIQANLFLFPAITVFSILEVLMASLAMLALSSLSKSSRFVAIMYAGVIFFTESIYAVVRAVTGGTSASWISFDANLTRVGDAIFRLEPRYETPLLVSLFMIVALMAASLVILERRVRGVEVVT